MVVVNVDAVEILSSAKVGKEVVKTAFVIVVTGKEPVAGAENTETVSPAGIVLAPGLSPATMLNEGDCARIADGLFV